ncbi:GNAT family N-acetyltransferase [Flavivirga amylovorans]|uniref:GNAT family N-acetyltransferase n=1 Tax=Flavivirga amylovorans TaxID=870486 RepID=A0ABT8X2F2_9FLAO|nr:GNAT family N-acetyltransferase [Flavivirga amylovorans]MDO5987893.1 GNAT family N-acetyltransferase [Flavivirga amylovorans]
MSIKNKIEAFPVLFKSNEVKQMYSSIEYFDLKVANNVPHGDFKSTLKDAYSHRLIPEYFTLNLRDSSLKSKVIPQYNWGYSILLHTSDSIEGYMNRQFNSKKRNIFTRYVKRLESCFNISYKMFHGDISKIDYDSIMESLRHMITRRFEERNELHKNLHEWDYLVEHTYAEIINNKASLFVIYNEEEPIEISLNYHFDKILFSYISSYNIDYSKFGLGHVEIYKQVEWCANNDYILFEMGVGGMDYKRRWSNNIYRYNHYVTYKNLSIKSKYKAKLLITKIKIKEYLKSKGVNEIHSKYNKYFTKKSNLQSNITLSEIKVTHDLNVTNFEEIQQHTINTYSFLKKHIYNFLYTTKGHLNDVKIYKHNKENSFLIKGEKSYQKVICNT